MAFYTNSLNFPNLTTKTVPANADIVLIADSASSPANQVKQTTISDILALVPAGSSGLTWIASVTASSVTNVTFNNNITSTYDNYLILGENIIQQTNTAILQLQVGTGATPTYQTSGYVGGIISIGSYSGSTSTIDCFASGGANNNTTRTESIFVTINTVNSAANDKVIKVISSYQTASASTITGAIVVGNWESATVVTSIKILMSSGNLVSGTFKLYGFQN